MKNAFAALFPGQGSQSAGMLSDLAAQHPLVSDYFKQASIVLNEDLWKIVQENPDEKLNQTVYTQPAMLAADVAVYQCWRQAGGNAPIYAAGHSLGEYAALVCAQAFTFPDAVRLVAKRAELMQAAVPSGVGAMAAVVGLSDEQVQQLCAEASNQESVAPANYNAIGQVVIAGHTAAVKRACVLAESLGARMAKLIPVSVPAHCALLEPIAADFSEFINGILLQTPKLPVIHNVDAQPHQHPDDIRDALVRQLYHPVRWVETIQFLANSGINQAVEFGPGKVLTGLSRRIDKAFNTQAIYDLTTLEKNLGTTTCK